MGASPARSRMSAPTTTTDNLEPPHGFVVGSFVHRKRIARLVCRIGDHAVLRNHPDGNFSSILMINNQALKK